MCAVLKVTERNLKEMKISEGYTGIGARWEGKTLGSFPTLAMY